MSIRAIVDVPRGWLRRLSERRAEKLKRKQELERAVYEALPGVIGHAIEEAMKDVVATAERMALASLDPPRDVCHDDVEIERAPLIKWDDVFSNNIKTGYLWQTVFTIRINRQNFPASFVLTGFAGTQYTFESENEAKNAAEFHLRQILAAVEARRREIDGPVQ